MHPNKEVCCHRNNCNFQESPYIWGEGVYACMCVKEREPADTDQENTVSW